MGKVNLISYIFLFVLGCHSGEGHQPLLDLSVDKKLNDTPVPNESILYSDVKPIFEVRCSRCHPAWSQPNWLDCAQATKYAQNGRLAERALGDNPTMPMMGSPESTEITTEDRETIAQWIADGAQCD